MKTEMSMRVGARMRQARIELGLNQRQVAARIESDAVNNQRISDWERGINQPSDRYMQDIAAALEREVGWFFTDPAADSTADAMTSMNGAERLDRIEAKLDELLRLSARKAGGAAAKGAEFERELAGGRRPPRQPGAGTVGKGDAPGAEDQAL